ncbi:hypothetical protein B0H11DRAFT_1974764 [Mycena galericulata]|nr:hypothetical protein B0H11DRAFT_1974764 [Mycena galericulata]
MTGQQSPGAYLHVLPVEIWLACWMLCSTRQLRRLSLVCRLFRSVCSPLLLRQQSADIAALVAGLDRNNWVERVHRLHRTAVRLDKLATGPRILAVRAWRFSSAPPLPLDQTTLSERLRRFMGQDYSHILNIGTFNNMRDRVLTTFLATLGRYQNLLSLNLQGMTIDTSLRQTLGSLPMLSELTLDGCKFAPRDGVLLALQRFTISATRRRRRRMEAGATGEEPRSTEAPLKIVSPQHLCDLNLGAVNQTASLLSGFSGEKFPQLLHLSVHTVFHVGILVQLLPKCPQLESLTIPSISTRSASSLPSNLAPHVVPLLRNLTAPMEIIHLFPSHRPLSVVTVLNPDPADTISLQDVKHILTQISRSSVPLRSLSIPRTSSAVEALALISSIFPALTELSMNIFEAGISPPHEFRCGTRQIPDRREDTRSPELNDEEAFDNLPADELSDSEEQPPVSQRDQHKDSPTPPLWALQDRRTGTYIESSLPPIPSGTCADFLRRICVGVIAFPPNLAVLRLQTPIRRALWAADHAAVAALSRDYPLLREVSIGCFTWEIYGADSYKVISRPQRP